MNEWTLAPIVLVGCYWTAMDANVRFWHKADVHVSIKKSQFS